MRYAQTYEKYNYCSKCVQWHDKGIMRCPDCKAMLRRKPRSAESRRLYV